MQSRKSKIIIFAAATLLIAAILGAFSEADVKQYQGLVASKSSVGESVNKAEKTTEQPAPESNTAIPQAKNTQIAQGLLTAHFIDVGQGDSILIELPDGKTALIDAGPKNSSSKVTSLIKQLGYSKIDYLIATHPHEDHIGGMSSVIELFDVGEIWAPKVSHNTQTFENFLDAVANKGLTIKTAVAKASGTQIFASGGASMNILYPFESSAPKDLNDWSIITQLEFGDTSFLFAGDANSSIITDSCKKPISVLKVSHHGSKVGTSATLISKLKPTNAVISCGAGNDYGHPSESTLAALANTTLYRTDLNGTIKAISNGLFVTFVAEHYNDAKEAAGVTTDEVTNPQATVGGEVTAAPPTANTDAETIVYITKSGSKYHVDGCRHLSKSKIPISLKEAKAQGYEPCSVCNPPT